jgi:DNA-binding beta-propeller fold protein YncE
VTKALRVGLEVAAAALCVAVVGVVLLCCCAYAAVTHELIRQAQGLGRPVELAVGPAGPEVRAVERDAVFVADHDDGVVDRLSSTDQMLPFECKTAQCGKYVEGDKLTGTPDGRFAGILGVAVDDATGEIYVSTGPAVDVFSASGEYLSQITGVPASSGAAVSGALTESSGLAFDQDTGKLYVCNEGTPLLVNDVVDEFKTRAPGKAEYVSQLGNGTLTSSGSGEQNVAVAEGSGGLVEPGTVYVTNRSVFDGKQTVDVFGSLGALESEWTGATTPIGRFGPNFVFLGIDPVSGDVYGVDRWNRMVEEFAASVSEEFVGRLTGTPSGRFWVPTSVTVAATGDVLVGDFYEEAGVGLLDVFGPDVELPDVSAELAWEAPLGEPGGFFFEYGLTGTFGFAASWSEKPR